MKLADLFKAYTKTELNCTDMDTIGVTRFDSAKEMKALRAGLDLLKNKFEELKK